MSERSAHQGVTGRFRRHMRWGQSLSTLVTAVVVAIFLVSAIALTVVIAWQNSNARRQEADRRARATAEVLAQLYADAAQQHGFRGLGGVKVILENWFAAGSGDQDLAWAFIRNAQGQVVVGQLRAHLVNPPAHLKTDPEIRDWFFAHHEDLGEAFIRNSAALEREAEGDRTRYAEVKIGYSLARIERDFQQQLIYTSGLSLVTAALLSLIMLAFFRRTILKPIKTLARAMEDVRRGWFDAHVPDTRGDEIGALAKTFNYMVVGLGEREQLADAFQRHVGKQVLDKLMSSGGSLQTKGETRRTTVLFSDIRGFTSMAEKLLPEQVVGTLNEYFTDMVEVVDRHDGFINKFIGDAMLVVWGAPFDHDQPELRAVRAALEMVEALEKLNERREARGEDPLKIGIGIATGFTVAGNIGHVDRLEYTVIGDTVNVAQRIEEETKKVRHDILIPEETYRAVADFVDAEALPTMLVKGKSEPLQIYAVHRLQPVTPLPPTPPEEISAAAPPTLDAAPEPPESEDSPGTIVTENPNEVPTEEIAIDDAERPTGFETIAPAPITFSGANKLRDNED